MDLELKDLGDKDQEQQEEEREEEEDTNVDDDRPGTDLNESIPIVSGRENVRFTIPKTDSGLGSDVEDDSEINDEDRLNAVRELLREMREDIEEVESGSNLSMEEEDDVVVGATSDEMWVERDKRLDARGSRLMLNMKKKIISQLDSNIINLNASKRNSRELFKNLRLTFRKNGNVNGMTYDNKKIIVIKGGKFTYSSAKTRQKSVDDFKTALEKAVEE